MSAYVRSILSADGVAELVRDHYGLEPTRCTLVRSLVNEVFAVDTLTGRFAFKVYRTSGAPRAHTRGAVCWEQGLAAHLIQSGLPVPAPLALLSGQPAGRLEAPEGPRPFALTEWVTGAKPAPPWTDQLYRDFGALTATFHRVAGDFRSDYPRELVDPWESLGEATDQVLEWLADADDRELVIGRVSAARSRLTDLSAELTWGVRHGDVSLDNVHLGNGALTLHDFDRSGPGWLASDLTGVWSTPHWPAFRSGYGNVRPLSAADHEALPWIRVVDLLFNLRFHLVDKPLIFGAESRGEGWVERELDSLREQDLSPTGTRPR